MSGPLAVRRLGGVPLTTALELAFTVLTFYMLSEGPLLLSLGGAPAAASGVEQADTSSVLLFTPVYAVVLLQILRWPRTGWRVGTADWLLIGLVGFAVVSLVWSTAPPVTLRRTGAVIGTSLFGVYLTQRYATEEWLQLLGWALAFNVLANAFLWLTHSGTAGAEGFAGVYGNKNTLGRMMSLATLVFLLVAWFRRSPAVLPLAALSLAMLLAAGSATALVALVTVVSIIPLFRMLAKDARAGVVIAIVAVLVLGGSLLVGTPQLPGLASLIGKDVTLSGRTDLWVALLGMIARRPWLGYGFNAFWSEEFGAGVSVEGWLPTQAHNGYIDLTLDLGLIGLLLFVIGLARGAGRAVRAYRDRSTPEGLWPLLYLCFLALYNISESTNMAPQSLFWALYVCALLTVAPRVARFRHPAGATSPGPAGPDASALEPFPDRGQRSGGRWR
jgi:exopolysaccharide production protein ExoQ